MIQITISHKLTAVRESRYPGRFFEAAHGVDTVNPHRPFVNPRPVAQSDVVQVRWHVHR